MAKYCTKCGTQCDEQSKFCVKCGAEIETGVITVKSTKAIGKKISKRAKIILIILFGLMIIGGAAAYFIFGNVGTKTLTFKSGTAELRYDFGGHLVEITVNRNNDCENYLLSYDEGKLIKVESAYNDKNIYVVNISYENGLMKQEAIDSVSNENVSNRYVTVKYEYQSNNKLKKISKSRTSSDYSYWSFFENGQLNEIENDDYIYNYYYDTNGHLAVIKKKLPYASSNATQTKTIFNFDSESETYNSKEYSDKGILLSDYRNIKINTEGIPFYYEYDIYESECLDQHVECTYFTDDGSVSLTKTFDNNNELKNVEFYIRWL